MVSGRASCIKKGPDGALYAGEWESDGTRCRVHWSTDDGLTWLHTADLVPTGGLAYINSIARAPNGGLFAATEAGLWKTSQPDLPWTKVDNVPNAAWTENVFLTSGGSLLERLTEWLKV